MPKNAYGIIVFLIAALAILSGLLRVHDNPTLLAIGVGGVVLCIVVGLVSFLKSKKD